MYSTRSLRHQTGLPRSAWFAVLVLGVLAVVVTPADAQMPLRAESPAGTQLEIFPADGGVRIGEPQSWRLKLTDSQGSPRDPISVSFRGGMPEHGHGLPEAPTVAKSATAGAYDVYPVTLNMGGFWVFVVTVGESAGIEEFRLELRVAEQGGSTAIEVDSRALALMRTLSVSSLPAVADPTNRFSGDPAAVALGEKLFFSPQFSSNNTVSCASCHQPERAFTDGLATSVGLKETKRNAMTLIGAGQGRWFYSDGRRDSLWAQALVPLETKAEMGTTRSDVVRLLLGDESFATDYLSVIGESEAALSIRQIPAGSGPFADGPGRQRWQSMPQATRVAVNSHFANAGKLIAAYEETLQPAVSRFDRYVDMIDHESHAQQLLSESERNGLALFLDSEKTQCLRCHNGPMFTNQGFHAIGSEASFLDLGFYVGIQSVQLDPFNCSGRFSDDRDHCLIDQMRSVDLSHYSLAFKVPTLRELTKTGPYFHDGRFSNLEQVMEFYRNPPPSAIESGELTPLRLSDDEVNDLIAFLLSLSSES